MANETRRQQIRIDGAARREDDRQIRFAFTGMASRLRRLQIQRDEVETETLRIGQHPNGAVAGIRDGHAKRDDLSESVGHVLTRFLVAAFITQLI